MTIALTFLALLPMGCKGNDVPNPIQNSVTGENGKTLKVLYWNIRNGMWTQQASNYDQFVKIVNEIDPDVCVFCEAQTIYTNNSEEEHCAAGEQYLTANWGTLAKRYNHNYWKKAAHRDNYPQVITSKYPITTVATLGTDAPGGVVVHGAGHFKINVDGKDINFVTLHLWPLAQSFDAPWSGEEYEKSVREHGGDKYRAKEMDIIVRNTIMKSPNAANEYWLQCGDHNSFTRRDKEIAKTSSCASQYAASDDHPQWFAQDVIDKNTPYVDVIREKFPNTMEDTWPDWGRIDYIYLSPALYNYVKEAKTLRDKRFTDLITAPNGSQTTISDHLPLYVEFDFSK